MVESREGKTTWMEGRKRVKVLRRLSDGGLALNDTSTLGISVFSLSFMMSNWRLDTYVFFSSSLSVYSLLTLVASWLPLNVFCLPNDVLLRALCCLCCLELFLFFWLVALNCCFETVEPFAYVALWWTQSSEGLVHVLLNALVSVCFWMLVFWDWYLCCLRRFVEMLAWLASSYGFELNACAQWWLLLRAWGFEKWFW